jgi:hypothetical protein
MATRVERLSAGPPERVALRRLCVGVSWFGDGRKDTEREEVQGPGFEGGHMGPVWSELSVVGDAYRRLKAPAGRRARL